MHNNTYTKLDSTFDQQVHLSIALIDLFVQVPVTTSNVNLTTADLTQLDTKLSQFIDQQLKDSVYDKEHSILRTTYQIMDQSIVEMPTPSGGTIKVRVLNGQLQTIYTGSPMDNFDRYWNNVLMMKTDSSLLTFLSSVMVSYSTQSSMVGASSYYFSPCLNNVSKVLAKVGDTRKSDSTIRGLIISTCLLGISFISSLVYILCFSSMCKSFTLKREMNSAILKAKKNNGQDIVACDTYSSDGSNNSDSRGILGATSLPIKPKNSMKNMDVMSQYDMESICSPTSKASDSSSVTSQKPLGIMSVQTLRRLMYSPKKETVLIRDFQDPYNMTMSGAVDDEEEEDEDTIQNLPSVYHIEH